MIGSLSFKVDIWIAGPLHFAQHVLLLLLKCCSSSCVIVLLLLLK